jgi:UDP-N-acetylmuramoyl-tripeptide--D-alanyl-D-alanine ligase
VHLFTVGEAVEITGGKLEFGSPCIAVSGASSDSRYILPGDMFVAIRGERTDGHAHLPQAFARGAALALVEHIDQAMVSLDNGNNAVIICKDPVIAMGKLAAWHRNKFSPRVVGITGSVGKTTTKDMIASVLRRRYHTLANEGNLNTEVGVPLTLFRLRAEHEVLVVEMGMRGPGQIAYLAGLAKPEIGVLTNIGETHLEVMGSMENTADAKAELLRALPADGQTVLNRDNAWVSRIGEAYAGKKLWYGIDSSAEITAESIVSLFDRGMEFTLVTPAGRVRVHEPLPGLHNVSNALAAAGVGLILGMTVGEISDGLTQLESSGQRSEVLEIGGFRLINDTYNSSPASSKAALGVLRNLARGKRTIAVLGNMLELGSYSQKGHIEVGVAVAENGIDVLITVGELARDIALSAREQGLSQVSTVMDNEEAARLLLSMVRPEDTVLIKGSRGVQMENLVATVKRHFGIEVARDAVH